MQLGGRARVDVEDATRQADLVPAARAPRELVVANGRHDDQNSGPRQRQLQQEQEQEREQEQRSLKLTAAESWVGKTFEHLSRIWGMGVIVSRGGWRRGGQRPPTTQHHPTLQGVACNLASVLAISSLPWTKWSDSSSAASSVPVLNDWVLETLLCVIFPVFAGFRVAFAVASFDPLPVEVEFGWQVGWPGETKSKLARKEDATHLLPYSPFGSASSV